MADAFTIVPGAYAGGLRYLDVIGDAATGRVFLHGAHVTSWRPDGEDESLVWLSERAIFADETAIRGGVPICFPWFGPNRPTPEGPAHGLARLSEWRFEGAAETDAGVAVTLGLDQDAPAAVPGWGAAFRVDEQDEGEVRFQARYTVTFGSSLTTSLSVTNTGSRAIGFEAAIHTYYPVSDVRQVSVSGLEGYPFVERGAGGGAGEPIRFTREVDRVYPAAPSALRLTDPGAGRRFTLESSGAAGWVVWNPFRDKAAAMGDFGDEEWRSMVCLEPVSLGEAMIWLQPGQSHGLGVVSTPQTLPDR